MIQGNEPQLVQNQYSTSANLEVRIALHRDFSTNAYGWLRWVFDQLTLPANAQILEVGCGTGALWAENSQRIPTGWEITLSDQSAGMVQQAQQNVQQNVTSTGSAFRFDQINVQAIPLANASVDAVIANHMLYHVPDLPQALSELQRVLKPGGWLFAATNGLAHMAELNELTRRFDPELDPKLNFSTLTFRLENGAALIGQHFEQVELRIYEDALRVTAAQPLVDYVFSMASLNHLQPQPNAELQRAFSAFVEQELAAQKGIIQIGKASGLFIARKV